MNEVSPQNPRKFNFVMNSNAMYLEIFSKTKDELFLSALSVKTTISLGA